MGILPRTDTVPENAALVNYSAKVNYGKGRHGDMLALKGCARHAQLRSSWQSQELGDGELRRQEAILFEQGWRRCLQRRLEQVPRQQGAPVLQHRPSCQGGFGEAGSAGAVVPHCQPRHPGWNSRDQQHARCHHMPQNLLAQQLQLRAVGNSEPK